MMTRRMLLAATGGLATAALSPRPSPARPESRAESKVAVVKNTDRAVAIPQALALLGINPVQGKRVLIKPNFNTADPFPASTHNDTLVALIGELRRMGATDLAIGERCGPPVTANVMQEKGIPELCERLGVRLINFEELPPEGWVRVRPASSHWSDGFDIAKPILDAEAVVTTCCLKTHGFGGVFTLSLKLAVGMTHKHHMRELHASFRSMRKMIAEINTAYRPGLILMDGIEVFTDGGPSRGTLKHAGVILASADRVAIDAVGLCVLKEQGSKADIMETPVFRQEQIARAVELGLGIDGPAGIRLVTGDGPSRAYAERLQGILDREAA